MAPLAETNNCHFRLPSPRRPVKLAPPDSSSCAPTARASPGASVRTHLPSGRRLTGIVAAFDDHRDALAGGVDQTQPAALRMIAAWIEDRYVMAHRRRGHDLVHGGHESVPGADI